MLVFVEDSAEALVLSSMKEMRRRFCDAGWRFAHNGAVFTGASSITVTRYRYRGSNIPTPWTPTPPAAPNG
jgi:RNA-directed DNA polymerase